MRAKGFQGLVMVKKGTTWGTAVAGGAGDGLRVLSLETPGNTELIEDRSIGSVAQLHGYGGNRTVDVTLVTNLRYEGNGRLIAGVLGTAGVPTTIDVSAKQHDYKVAEQIDGIFWALAYELVKDTKVIEVPSVKWNRLVLRARAGQACELELSGIGFDWKDDSAVNTTTTIDTVTTPTADEQALFKQAVLLANAQGGAALAGPGDGVFLASFEVTIERSLERRITTEFGDKTIQPIESDFCKVSGSLEFGEARDGTGGNLAFMAEQMAATRKKAKLNITSPNLAGAATQKYEHVLWLPNVQFGAGKPGIPGPQGQTWTLPFQAWRVTAIPTGFPTGFTGPVSWQNFNVDAADPLA